MTVSEKTQTETEVAMTELTVRVPTRLVEMAQAQVASGRFADVGEVVGDALLRLEERERREDELVALLEEAEESYARGEYREWTPSLMSEIAQEARERHARGEQPSPHVCP